MNNVEPQSAGIYSQRRFKTKDLSFIIYIDSEGNARVEEPRESVIVSKLVTKRYEKEEIWEPGGMVVLSTDVTPPQKEKIIEAAMRLVRTCGQRLFRKTMTHKEITQLFDIQQKQKPDKEIATGWQLGKNFDGYYYEASKKALFDENSFTITMYKVDFDFVKEMALALRDAFHQWGVIAVDLRTNTPHLLYWEEKEEEEEEIKV